MDNTKGLTQAGSDCPDAGHFYGREVAAALLEGQPLAEVARLITEVIASQLQVERVGLFLHDERGNIDPIALRNVSPEYGKAITRIVPMSPIMSHARATGQPVVARNVQQNDLLSPELRELYRLENISSLLLIILQYEQKFAGVLVVYPDAERVFAPQELAAFQSLADMATLAIALSQRFQQQREIAMLEERNRLAREIHDTVAQSLAVLILQMETTRIALRRADISGAEEMLAQAHGLAKNALEDTRRAVRGLAASAAQILSPAQAIAQEAEQLEAESGISAQFILSGEEQALNPDQRASLLRIAQEALTNARKHAQPSRVRVGLQYGAEEVTLLVEDDGVGFDPDAERTPGAEGGYGLFGIRERAKLVGAALYIDSTPGWGTRLRVSLPYRPATPIEGRRGEEETRRRGEEEKIQVQGTGDRGQGTGEFLSTLNSQLSTASSLSPIKVLIVDDHALARQGIRAMLQTSSDIVVVGEAENGEEAVDQAIKLEPDVVLMDLQMPKVDGLEGLRRLQIRRRHIPVIILTTLHTEHTISEALQSGARGFLLKDTNAEELLAAVHAAKRGETLLAPAIATRLADLTAGHGRFDLNEREREILQLLAQGARNKEIATALFIAPKTVEYHLSNLFTKLGVSNRTEATRLALEQGLVPPIGRSPK